MGIPICTIKEDTLMAAMVQEYDAKLDSRRRITIRCVRIRVRVRWVSP